MIRSVDSILDLEYFESLLPKLAAWDSGLRIFYEVKANLNRRQMEALGNAGIRWLQPGIESLSTPALRLMGKGITAWRNVRTLRYGAELAMSLSWNLLAGFPGEEPSWCQEMVPLVEALTHLQPPSGLVYVRLDKFSPLYDLRETNGLAEVRPAPGYEIIFRTNPASLARLAMHFTFRYADSRNPSGYLAPLAVACDSWRAEAGRAAFMSVRRRGTIELYDTRAIAAEERVTLRGVAAAVFQACRDGATAGEVARKVSAFGAARTVRRALERLVERRWVARIDDRYLSLAVSVAEQGEDGGPDLAELAVRHAGLMARRLAVQTRPPLSFDRLHSRPGRCSPATARRSL
jgi:ribosomal peptide maturation radical SAM protein 1